MAKTIFYSLAAIVRKILFCHSKIKFISSGHRVISSVYSEERSGKIYSFVWRYFFVSSRNTSTWHAQVLRVCFQNKFYYELNKLCHEISENSIFNSQLQFPSCSMVKIKFIRKYLLESCYIFVGSLNNQLHWPFPPAASTCLSPRAFYCFPFLIDLFQAPKGRCFNVHQLVAIIKYSAKRS